MGLGQPKVFGIYIGAAIKVRLRGCAKIGFIKICKSFSAKVGLGLELVFREGSGMKISIKAFTLFGMGFDKGSEYQEVMNEADNSGEFGAGSGWRDVTGEVADFCEYDPPEIHPITNQKREISEEEKKVKLECEEAENFKRGELAAGSEESEAKDKKESVSTYISERIDAYRLGMRGKLVFRNNWINGMLEKSLGKKASAAKGDHKLKFVYYVDKKPYELFNSVLTRSGDNYIINANFNEDGFGAFMRSS